jgi:hypothetical protein
MPKDAARSLSENPADLAGAAAGACESKLWTVLSITAGSVPSGNLRTLPSAKRASIVITYLIKEFFFLGNHNLDIV